MTEARNELLKMSVNGGKGRDDHFEKASQCMGEDRNDPSKRPTNV